MGGRYLQNLKYYFRSPDPRSLRLGDIRKIAVLRANALGDFIFTLPALEAIKHRYPAAELVLLGTAWHKAFLAGRPGPVDRVVTVPRCNGIPHQSNCVENAAEVGDFFSSMQGEGFDLAIQMHGGGRHSNPFIRSIGARLTIGMQDVDAIPLDINVPYCRYQNEVLRYLEVAKTIGAVPFRLEPSVTVTPADREELATRKLKLPYVVLHPGASDRRRRWPAEKFARVGDALAGLGLHVYLCGTEDEIGVTEWVKFLMRERAENLCNRLSLNAYAALLAGARMMIANDTGPLHLARAIGTPTVGIYWIVNLITSNAITVEKNRNCIAWNVYCPLCGADCVYADMQPPGECAHDASFVDAIPVAEVLRYAGSLINAPTRFNPEPGA